MTAPWVGRSIVTVVRRATRRPLGTVALSLILAALSLAYTLHAIDGTATYLADNWLQRPTLPLRGFAG